ncbi:Virginiamycin B lyase [Baekduia alba]|nr:Virginiamycin B lyase [Baekduia alba]
MLLLAAPLAMCSAAGARIDMHLVPGLGRVCHEAPRGESATAVDGSLFAVCRDASGRPVVARVTLDGAVRRIALAGLDARARRWFRARDLTWASDGALWFHDGGGEVVRISSGLDAKAFRLSSVARTSGLIAGRGGALWLTASSATGAQAPRAIVHLSATGAERRIAISRGSGAILPEAIADADGRGAWFREGVGRVGHVTVDGRHTTSAVSRDGRPVAVESDGTIAWLTFAPGQEVVRLGADGAEVSHTAVVPHAVSRPLPPGPGRGLDWSLCLLAASELCQLDLGQATLNTFDMAQPGAYLNADPLRGPGGALWTRDSKGHLLRVRADGQTLSYPLHPRHGNTINLLAASGAVLWMLEVNQHNRPHELTRVTTLPMRQLRRR